MQSSVSVGAEQAASAQKRQSSADKTLSILMALGELGLQFGGTVRLTDLVAYTGYPRPTVHRLLGELKRFGFAIQDEANGRYRLGPKLLLLSAQCLGGLDLRRIAHPLLRDLVDRVGHTCHMGVRDRQWMIFIDKVEPTSGMRIVSTIGQRREATATALGKASLAYESVAEVDALVAAGLPRRTPHTIATRERLLEDLQEVRQRGFAIDNEECDLGIRCVGAPIFDHTGAVVAAISVTTMVQRVSREEAEAIGRAVADTTALITGEMGGVIPAVSAPIR